MNAEEIRDYALSKTGAEESFPFGNDTLVFKVKNKIFLLVSLDSSPLQFNVKCDPEKAVQLREEYPDYILPGYHMNKKHWNTNLTGNISKKLLTDMIDASYNLVAKIK
ncbi:MAG: MmcQ/YjbR family DNA-binding protein [Ferruginibacter sp.]